MSGSDRLRLSLPLFGILAMLTASSVAAQPRPPGEVRGGETSGQARTPPASQGENFSANKTPAQLFQSDCTGAGCHKGPGGLAKGAGALGLTGFLREHYTNSRESASALAAYLAGAASAPESARPGRGEPAAPRPPRNAARTPAAGEEAKPEEGQGPLTPARPRRAAPGATASTPPAGENPPEIVRPEPGSKPEPGARPTPAAAQPRNQPRRGQPQHTAAPQPEPPPVAAAPPPPPPPPPPVHDIFD